MCLQRTGPDPVPPIRTCGTSTRTCCARTLPCARRMPACRRSCRRRWQPRRRRRSSCVESCASQPDHRADSRYRMHKLRFIHPSTIKNKKKLKKAARGTQDIRKFGQSTVHSGGHCQYLHNAREVRVHPTWLGVNFSGATVPRRSGP